MSAAVDAMQEYVDALSVVADVTLRGDGWACLAHRTGEIAVMVARVTGERPAVLRDRGGVPRLVLGEGWWAACSGVVTGSSAEGGAAGPAMRIGGRIERACPRAVAALATALGARLVVAPMASEALRDVLRVAGLHVDVGAARRSPVLDVLARTAPAGSDPPVFVWSDTDAERVRHDVASAGFAAAMERWREHGLPPPPVRDRRGLAAVVEALRRGEGPPRPSGAECATREDVRAALTRTLHANFPGVGIEVCGSRWWVVHVAHRPFPGIVVALAGTDLPPSPCGAPPEKVLRVARPRLHAAAGEDVVIASADTGNVPLLGPVVVARANVPAFMAEIVRRLERIGERRPWSRTCDVALAAGVLAVPGRRRGWSVVYHVPRGYPSLPVLHPGAATWP